MKRTAWLDLLHKLIVMTGFAALVAVAAGLPRALLATDGVAMDQAQAPPPAPPNESVSKRGWQGPDPAVPRSRPALQPSRT